MSLTATVGKERDLIEEGIFDGVCSKIIDLGTQYNETFKNSAHKIRIFWEIVGETIEINGEQMPRLVSKEFTLSLNEKSKLRQALQSWRGKAFTAEELQGFDLRKVLGVGCQLQIIHKEGSNGTTYANVETILALPVGGAFRPPGRSHGLISTIRLLMGCLKSCPGMCRRRSPRRKTLRTRD